MSTNWFTSNNWNCGHIPAQGDSAYIQTYGSGGTVTSIIDSTAQDAAPTPLLNLVSVGYTSSSDYNLIARLTVQNGGVLNSRTSNNGGVASGMPGSPPVQGIITVTGLNSIWNNNKFLLLGNYGIASLTVENGGKLNNGGDLTLGNSETGNGTLIIQSGGIVNANTDMSNGAHFTTIASSVGSTGSLSLLGDTTGQGILAVNELRAGNGTPTTHLNGGILRALFNNPTFISGFTGNQLTIESNGFFIDSNGFAIGTDNILSGTGPLVKQGLGTLTLSGINTYSGNTQISSGTLALNVAHSLDASNAVALTNAGSELIVNPGVGAQALNNLSSIIGSTVNLNDNIVTLNSIKNTTLGGMLTGTGNLIKQGNATLILSGNGNGFVGTTNVNAGSLEVDGSLGGTLIVSSAGTLQGTGSVNNAIIQGKIAPGNSIGVLKVLGSYTQTPSSIYSLEITPTSSDSIQVTGTATLSGNVELTRLPASGLYSPGQQFVILTATGGRNGTEYSDLLKTPLPFLDFILNYDNPNAVYLRVVRNTASIESLAATANQANVAKTLEELGLGNTIVDAVVNLASIDDVRKALDNLTGELHASTLGALMEESRYLRDAILTHLSHIGKDNATSTQLAYGFTAWAHGFGAWGDLKGNQEASKLDRQTQGFFVGAEHEIGSMGRLGLAGGYSHSLYNINPLSSINRNDSYHIALYADNYWHAFHARGGAAFSWHDLDAIRTISFPNFFNQVASDYHAHTKQGFAEIGYLLPFQRLIIEPLLSAAYVNVQAGPTYEYGGAAALNKQHNSEDVLYMTVGAQNQGLLYQNERMAIDEHIFLGWRHAYNNITPKALFKFSSGSTPFLITGTPIAKDALLINVGLEAMRSDKNVQLRLSYLGQVGSHVSDNAVAATLTWRLS